ncbi:MAG: NYN domain-containing protein [Suipraeoptans sp.]
MKQIVLGILAHVDSGKTTLSERLLYGSGALSSIGRVDNGTSFLDTYDLEKERGITIFSKEVHFEYKDTYITLIDTPGHIDFSAETERTLCVLDYAILVISGTSGVQGHTKTLWNLLEKYKIPTFIFVNKMDIETTDRSRLLDELKTELNNNIVDFTNPNASSLIENVALCSDNTLEAFLDTGIISDDNIRTLINERDTFPCYFGSALKSTGIDLLLDGLARFTVMPAYPGDFGARVFKISHEGNVRLTHMKITGGALSVKQSLSLSNQSDKSEKVNQIRIYNGEKFDSVNEIGSGNICAVTGLKLTKPGDNFGNNIGPYLKPLEPVLVYSVIPSSSENLHKTYEALKILEDEDPTLAVSFDKSGNHISAHIMGQIQTEVLTEIISRRFGLDITFGIGNVLYKETITSSVDGYGHFEPLKHYAEVHLRITPGTRDSGLKFESELSEDILNRNFQNLIINHLKEKEHLGVLTGSPLTDVTIAIIGGRSHIKHTEGGDFREATYRAVRQGLMNADNILLEPYYRFSISVKQELIGKVMSDLQQMNAEIEAPQVSIDVSTLSGCASVREIFDYPNTFLSLTHGEGSISMIPDGYRAVKNQSKIIENIAYNPDADLDNPSSSVFCIKGSATVIPYSNVIDYLQADLTKSIVKQNNSTDNPVRAANNYNNNEITDKELNEIFERTYGPRKDRSAPSKTVFDFEASIPKRKLSKPKKQYLLIDGYNIIFAWPALKELAEENLDAARDGLIEIMSNYQGFVSSILILVFDAYKRKEHAEDVIKYKNLIIVYTKTAETADQYIEKSVHEMANTHDVVVATSDYLEQRISHGQGSRLLSARELLDEVSRVSSEINSIISSKRETVKNYLLDHADTDTFEMLNEIRLGKKTP